MQELLDKVLESESTKSKWRKDYTSVEWQNASKLNKILFGIHLNQSPNCQCLEDLFMMAKRKGIKSKIMQQFKLKKGVVITSFLHATITEHSTDEDVLKALKVSKGIIKYFSVFPDNWEQLANGEKPKRKKKETLIVDEVIIEEPTETSETNGED